MNEPQLPADQCAACLALTITADRGGPTFQRRFCRDHTAAAADWARQQEAQEQLATAMVRSLRKERRKAQRSGNPAKRAGALR